MNKEKMILQTLCKELNLNYDIIFLHNDTAHNCYIKEQFILDIYSKNRIHINYYNFSSTECFNSNVLKEFII